MSLAVVLVGCSMPDDKNANIRKLCKEEALSQLKTPSVAKFANSFYQDRNILLHKEGEYLLPSAVDSQNSFGAMVRSNFVCSVKFKKFIKEEIPNEVEVVFDTNGDMGNYWNKYNLR